MVAHEFSKTCPTCGREFKAALERIVYCSRKCKRFTCDKPPAIERFMKFVRKLDNGCWEWTGYIDPDGYGSGFGTGGKNGKRVQAHRWSYRHFKKTAIPNGLTVDHLCHDPAFCPGGITCTHRRCVNPDHLGVCTGPENAARGAKGQKGLVNRERSLAKTHCRRGHELTPENTKNWNGRRLCRICLADYSREYEKTRPKRKR
jgi:hypothetical protein